MSYCCLVYIQLWEEDGLSDLCLIPYGCMATGPKTGFIEVVNNARTIAEVCVSVCVCVCVSEYVGVLIISIILYRYQELVTKLNYWSG